MSWHDSLTGEAFRVWLENRLAGTKLSPGQRLDPFGTSMRTFSNGAEWLECAERGDPLPARGGSGVQNFTDLRSAVLVAGSHSEPTLTELGGNVLARWRDVDVADADWAHELPRCYAVTQEAAALRDESYLQMLKFWAELRTLYSVAELLESPELLYLVSYLNYSVDGFNPWEVIVASGAPPTSGVDWEALAAAVPGRNETTDTVVDALKSRVDSFRSRARGRIVYCTALELYLAAWENPDTALAQVPSLTVPD
jgi:hypothetical protein